MCRGDNGFSSEGGLARLEVVVEFGPVLEEREIIHSSQGLPVTLHCFVEAVPEALVTWSMEGEELSPLHHTITREGGLHTLAVVPPVADTKDAQDISFSCQATNTRGNATKTFLVTSKPGQPVFTSSPNSSSSDSILLEWTVVTSLALESCQLVVLGPKSFTLNETLNSEGSFISGPESKGEYTGRYTLGPGLVEGGNYRARVRGTNSHGQGPESEWFVVTLPSVSVSPSSTCSIWPVILAVTGLLHLWDLL